MKLTKNSNGITYVMEGNGYRWTLTTYRDGKMLKWQKGSQNEIQKLWASIPLEVLTTSVTLITL